MRKIRNKNQGLIFVVSGPSGSGKTTLLKKILKVKELKNILSRSISFTTRPKRSAEQDKKDYFFIREKQFREKLKAEKILEWTKYLGYYYATPKHFVEQQVKDGKNIALCLDLKGALKIKQLYPKNTVMIFVMPPSLDVLQERIKKRSKKTRKEEIQQRIKLADKEILAAGKYDYCVVNTDLHKVIKELKNIILGELGEHLGF